MISNDLTWSLGVRFAHVGERYGTFVGTSARAVYPAYDKVDLHAGLDRNSWSFNIGVLLPQIKSEFLVSDTRLGLLSGITFACFYATLGMPLARWADRGDRKRILSFSLIVWSAMTALCGLASSFWQLVLARIGVGAGEAGAIPPAQSLIADYFPPERRAGPMGVFMMSSALGYGFGSGPVVGTDVLACPERAAREFRLGGRSLSHRRESREWGLMV